MRASSRCIFPSDSSDVQHKQGDSAPDNPGPGPEYRLVPYSTPLLSLSALRSGSQDSLPRTDPYICIKKTSNGQVAHRYLQLNIVHFFKVKCWYLLRLPTLSFRVSWLVLCISPAPTLLASLSWFVHNHPRKKGSDMVDVPQNKSLSDNCDSYFALQGIPWVMRKIMRVTSPEVGVLVN